jgi:hypothetical protein
MAHGRVDHQGEGETTQGVLWPLAPPEPPPPNNGLPRSPATNAHRPPRGVQCPRLPFPPPDTPGLLPLSRPQEANPGMGLLPPLSYMLGPDTTSKFQYNPFCLRESPTDNPPPVMGPRPNNFKPILARAADWKGLGTGYTREALPLAA